MRAMIMIMTLLLMSVSGVITTRSAVEGKGNNVVVVSTGDHIAINDTSMAAKLDTPSKIRECLKRWLIEVEAGKIYWRVSSIIIREKHQIANDYYKPMIEIEKVFSRFDPNTVAVNAAHELGIPIYAKLSIMDEGSPPTILYGGTAPFPWQSKFTIEHPEYLVVDRTGTKRQYGVMEFAYPEVRRYLISLITEYVDRYGFDGVFLSTRSHSQPADFADQFGYNEPVVREFKERYGVNIILEDFDKEKWRRLRGEYLTIFLRELRTEMNRRGKEVSIGIPLGSYIGPPFGNLYLDWETWVREKLIDELVVGWVSGAWLYPQYRGSDGLRGYLSSQEEGIGIAPPPLEVRQTYASRLANRSVRLLWTTSSRSRWLATKFQFMGAVDGFIIHSQGLWKGEDWTE